MITVPRQRNAQERLAARLARLLTHLAVPFVSCIIISHGSWGVGCFYWRILHFSIFPQALFFVYLHRMYGYFAFTHPQFVFCRLHGGGRFTFGALTYYMLLGSGHNRCMLPGLPGCCPPLSRLLTFRWVAQQHLVFSWWPWRMPM